MLERIAILLGVTLAHHRTEVALVERVKELTCLHGIARATGQRGIPLAPILEGIAALLPPAWQYPEAARARITLDGQAYGTAHFAEGWPRQAAPLIVRGQTRGAVEVAYAGAKPPVDEGPFLREERALIDSVAREVGSVIERQMSEAERDRLQEQVRQADRLATIGQLAAGVAHELNEPLATILGFAQLCRKHAGLPAAAAADLDKIIGATLHAREVVKDLMLFVRERPVGREWLRPGRILEDAIAFVEGRAEKAGIQIERREIPDLPEILADPHQLVQVLVNLAVNAIQATLPDGRIRFEVYRQENHVVFAVEDSGVGMTRDVAARVFEPFFTTKDMGQGTGLGLSVANQIVTAHGGRMQVQSELGQGSRFEVHLPMANGAPA